MRKIKKAHACITRKMARRVLAKALSFSILCTGMVFNWESEDIGTVWAYTVDDLRVFTGKGRLNSPEVRAQLGSMIYLYEKQELNKEVVDIINENDIDLSILDNMTALEEELEVVNGNIEKAFASDDALKVISLYREAQSLGARLEKFDTSALQYKGGEDTITEEDYVNALRLLDKSNDVFELGDIGKDLVHPTETRQLEVVLPFGNLVDDNLGGEIVHSNGLWIGNKSDDGEVRSLWNGVVLETGDSEVYGRYVKVGSSSSLNYLMGNLSEVYVSEGEEITQYEQLGKSNMESIYIEILLDDEYIDPVLVFGEKGRKAYYAWLSENSGIVLDHHDYSIIKDDIPAQKLDIDNNRTNNKDNEVSVRLYE